jgi:hypothetical protein
MNGRKNTIKRVCERLKEERVKLYEQSKEKGKIKKATSRI